MLIVFIVRLVSEHLHRNFDVPASLMQFHERLLNLLTEQGHAPRLNGPDPFEKLGIRV
jgi:hypothetical protein